VQVIGTPTDEELSFIRNEDARRYMRHLPQFPRRPFASLFPKVHPVALDLIQRMLTFNPLQRITGEPPATASNFLPLVQLRSEAVGTFTAYLGFSYLF
jgi:hypothetical protein